MKNSVLILLLMLLPWQSVLAADRNLTHVMGSGHGMALVVHHMEEHAGHVLHHHEDDDDDASDNTIHVDQSEKSVQHLADFEHGNTGCLLLSASLGASELPIVDREVAPWASDPFSNRTTSPLLRPPRAFV